MVTSSAISFALSGVPSAWSAKQAMILKAYSADRESMLLVCLVYLDGSSCNLQKYFKSSTKARQVFNLRIAEY